MTQTPFIPAWLRNAGLTPYEFTLYCYISSVGECWQALPSIYRACGMNDRTGKKAIDSLMGRGLLTRTDRRGQTSVFSVRTAAPCGSEPGADMHPVQKRTPRKNAPSPGADMHPPPGADMHPKGTPFEGYPFKEAADTGEDAKIESPQQDDQQTDNPAVQIIQAVDQAISAAFGPELARPFPAQTDFFTAQAWLALGLSVEDCAAVAGPILRRMNASGHSPPRALKYFDAPMQRAAQAKLTTGDRDHVQTSKTESVERVDPLERARNRLTRYPRPGVDSGHPEDAAAVLSAAQG